MERLVGLMVFFAVAALTVPAILSDNPQIIERELEPPAESPEAEPVTKKATLSSEERIGMNDQGHFVAQFRMNGRPVEAMVDTGATMVAINKSTARRLGITVIPADFKYSVFDSQWPDQSGARGDPDRRDRRRACA